ncbi:hypothetical protein GGTG_11502 [Gaeumannomyces tritici R3-111a-1]|uniref:Uncharacterized protein n=1 Tax=Gaeumannomyces tritici (strain R3-111a-1) TaxID=644352 RepID=J3PDD4_GAET3|nr:hypothetical protein GGTG_11502 [Gaeumannomyces tritici R3-111a-1]EJT70479.1 hypothetical protein GGTG_11502 [Gaeumannomyces tritici R3-111a-1]
MGKKRVSVAGAFTFSPNSPAPAPMARRQTWLCGSQLVTCHCTERRSLRKCAPTAPLLLASKLWIDKSVNGLLPHQLEGVHWNGIIRAQLRFVVTRPAPSRSTARLPPYSLSKPRYVGAPLLNSLWRDDFDGRLDYNALFIAQFASW